MTVIRFMRLMDRLEIEEEERFLAACAALDAAWQKFFSAVLVRHPGAEATVRRLEAARQATQDAIVPLFTGEADPVLTPAWAHAVSALEAGYGEFSEVLKS